LIDSTTRPPSRSGIGPCRTCTRHAARGEPHAVSRVAQSIAEVSKQTATHDDYGPVESWHEQVQGYEIEFDHFK
jgi:hypothetical protein